MPIIIAGDPATVLDDQPSSLLETFTIEDIMVMIGDQYGVPVELSNIDDECYGCVIQKDNSLAQFLNDHAELYNYQIRDARFSDGSVQLIRRAIGDDLAIDLEIDELECIPAGQGSPHIRFSRADPMSLPLTVEVQFMNPDRGFAIDTQRATNHAARIQNGTVTIASDFCIDGGRARALAFDVLYRKWASSTAVTFEHPNPNIEPGDVLLITGGRGSHTVLVQECTLTKRKTTEVTRATALLTQSGIIIGYGRADVPGDFDAFAAWLYTK